MLKKNVSISNNILNIILSLIIINSINSIIIKPGNQINISCENNILYIIISVYFSEEPKEAFYPFVLTMESPKNFKLKCMLDYTKTKIFCLHSFSNSNDLIKKGTYFKFPNKFPIAEEIEWDYLSYINEIYRRIYKSKFECGKENLISVYHEWDIQGSIKSFENGICQPSLINKENYYSYNFDLIVSFTNDEYFTNTKSDIYLLQNISIPLITKYKKISFYAYCESSDPINKDNISKYSLKCKIPIKYDFIFNDKISIKSFFDRIFILKENKIELVNIYIYANEIETSLTGIDSRIICPNFSVFTIKNKKSILIEELNQYNKLYFSMSGTLSNGYYSLENGPIIKLNQTYKNIIFNLTIQNNLIDSKENFIQTKCILPEGSLYNAKDKAIIKCSCENNIDFNPDNNNDINLNWNLKNNNNLSNLIIKWPKSYDKIGKNLYLYKLIGIAMKQKDYGCVDNNFIFYVYIYDLGREPIISFELPLSSPKGAKANCILLDKITLKCSLNLKYKKLSKDTKITLPKKGVEHIIETSEKNIVSFEMNNFMEINNENDYFIKLKETCGNYLIKGIFMDISITQIIYIIIILVIIILFTIIVINIVFLRVGRVKKEINICNIPDKSQPANFELEPSEH